MSAQRLPRGVNQLRLGLRRVFASPAAAWSWAALAMALVLLFGWPGRPTPAAEPGPQQPIPEKTQPGDRGPSLVFSGSGLGKNSALDVFAFQRRQMVDKQLRSRGIKQEEVLEVMGQVPRHEFVILTARDQAYDDHPVAFDSDRTISQPYVVALMTEALNLDGDERVLEIGTGSGYHTAVLSRLAKRVFTIEIDPTLGTRARRTLARLGFTNVESRIGDGYKGWPEAAPFDAVILTAAPPRIPKPLVDQLKVGGKMVVSLGHLLQDLVLLEKQADGSISQRRLAPVRLPQMTGEVQQPPEANLGSSNRP